MDWYPVQGGVAILLGLLHATETGISSGSVTEALAGVRLKLFSYNVFTGLFSLCLIIFLNFVHNNPKENSMSWVN